MVKMLLLLTLLAQSCLIGFGGSITYSYTGSVQSFVVPAGVWNITVDAQGAKGRNRQGIGGLGARIVAVISVVPLSSLDVYVGGKGSNVGGFNGGGSSGQGYPAGKTYELQS